jgi:hypothetical protein
MKQELEKFLTEKDLDDLLAARKSLGQLDSTDIDIVISILSQWDNSQAIANLLLYPKTIPSPIRSQSILKGLHENYVIYYRLAAIVGLQSLNAADFNAIEVEQIRDRLIQLIASDRGVIAARASVAIALYLQANDTDRVVALLNHPYDLVKHNLLVALIELVGVDRIRDEIDRAAQAKQISEDSAAFCQAKFSKILELSDNSATGVPFDSSDLSLPMLSHIPNLKDVMGES